MDFAPDCQVRPIEPLADFLRELFLTGDRQVEAKRRLESATRDIPALANLRHFPQTPPDHAEGLFVFSHLERSLAGLLALQSGGSVLGVLEFSSHPDLLIDLASAEETARENAPLMNAYLFSHVLGVDEGATFFSQPGTRAFTEKFIGPITPQSLQHYEKLWRGYGYSVDFGVRLTPSCCSQQAWSSRYSADRETILIHCGVPVSYAKMLVELLRALPAARTAFALGTDHIYYQTLVAQAGRAGLNHDLFLRLVSACLLVDDVLGRLSMMNDRIYVPSDILLNFFRAEHEAAPARRAARVRASERHEKDRIKAILGQAQLSSEEIFALLETPFGPERGTVMRDIEETLMNPDFTPDFGVLTTEIMHRVQLARRLLSRDNS